MILYREGQCIHEAQVTIRADVRRQLGASTAGKAAFVFTDEGTVELRPAGFTRESVPGSNPALPNESVDLDRDIAEAAERMRRK